MSITIALGGASNAGKSTLINQFMGRDMSIVSPKIHTTQRTLTFIYEDKENQRQAILLDGAGTSFTRKGQALKPSTIMSEADILLIVIDARIPWSDAMRQDATTYYGERKGTAYVVLNKIDKTGKEQLLPRAQEATSLLKADGCFMVSAKTGDGCATLWHQLLQHPVSDHDGSLVSSLPAPLDEESLAREFTREALFYLLEQELPYSTHVRSLSFENKENGRIEIYQEILTDKNSRKAILIGKNGAMIKSIGIRTRHRMEAFFQKRVNVFLQARLVKSEQLTQLQQEQIKGAS